MRPSDSWAKSHTAPAYSSFPSDIRHTKTRQNLVDNNCDVSSLQQSQFEEVQLGMLLTGSSSGNVYRGMWRSIPVAVKVRAPGLSLCLQCVSASSLVCLGCGHAAVVSAVCVCIVSGAGARKTSSRVCSVRLYCV